MSNVIGRKLVLVDLVALQLRTRAGVVPTKHGPLAQADAVVLSASLVRPIRFLTRLHRKPLTFPVFDILDILQTDLVHHALVLRAFTVNTTARLVLDTILKRLTVDVGVPGQLPPLRTNRLFVVDDDFIMTRKPLEDLGKVLDTQDQDQSLSRDFH